MHTLGIISVIHCNNLCPTEQGKSHMFFNKEIFSHSTQIEYYTNKKAILYCWLTLMHKVEVYYVQIASLSWVQNGGLPYPAGFCFLYLIWGTPTSIFYLRNAR